MPVTTMTTQSLGAEAQPQPAPEASEPTPASAEKGTAARDNEVVNLPQSEPNKGRSVPAPRVASPEQPAPTPSPARTESTSKDEPGEQQETTETRPTRSTTRTRAARDTHSPGEGRAEVVIEEIEETHGAKVDKQTRKNLLAQQQAVDLGAQEGAVTHDDPYRGLVPPGFRVQSAHEEGVGPFTVADQQNVSQRLAHHARELGGEEPYTFLLEPVGNENRWRYHITFLIRETPS